MEGTFSEQIFWTSIGLLMAPQSTICHTYDTNHRALKELDPVIWMIKTVYVWLTISVCKTWCKIFWILSIKGFLQQSENKIWWLFHDKLKVLQDQLLQSLNFRCLFTKWPVFISKILSHMYKMTSPCTYSHMIYTSDYTVTSHFTAIIWVYFSHSDSQTVCPK